MSRVVGSTAPPMVGGQSDTDGMTGADASADSGRSRHVSSGGRGRRSRRLALPGAHELPGRRLRRVAVAIVALTLLVVAGALGLMTGSLPLDLSRVLQALFATSDTQAELVVGTLRLPRVVTGLAVGAALGLAGALTQTVARNPLASPDILGVTSGASVGAVAVVVLAGGNGGVSGGWASVGVPTAAVVGAAVAAALVALLARSTERIILVGVGVTAAAQALVAWMLVLGDVQQAGRAAAWLAGSLNARSWLHAWPVLAAVALAVLPCLVLGRALSVVGLGDDAAQGLGARVNRTRFVALAVATVLAGVATAAAGPIAFVGLAAPQVVVRLARAERPPLLASALAGAALVVVADLLARNAFSWFADSPTELPVGIVTALVGASYLAALLSRKARLR